MNKTVNETIIYTNYSCEYENPDHLLSNIYFKTSVYTMYSIIFVIAVIGNGIVCYLVMSSSRMRTVTNYFIMNLAVGDMLITILCVPFTSLATLKQYWPFGSLMCLIVNYSSALSVFVSAYTLVAISIDRYMVIMWPLKPRISKSIAVTVIVIVWTVAGITVLPVGIFTKLYQPLNPDGNTSIYVLCNRYVCREDYSEVGEEYKQHYTQILMVLQYIIPSVVLLFTYTSIAIVIWCHRIPGEAENSRDQRMARSKKRMIKMMVTVVFVYTLCWLPYNILMLFDNMNEKILMFIYFPLHGLAVSHACYNPIIYCYMNTRFRDGFLLIIKSIPFIGQRLTASSSAMSTAFHHTDIGGTDSTLLHRNNTCTTYMSMKRKNRLSGYNTNHQLPVRSVSLMRNTTNASNSGGNCIKRIRYPNDIIDEQI